MTTLVDRGGLRLCDLARRGPGRGAPQFPWLARIRNDASAWIEAHGFPTQKEEDWRYLPLGPVLAEPFEPASRAGGARGGDVRAKTAIDAVSLGLRGSRLVFVNGRFAQSLSRLSALPGGARISSLASALRGDPDGVRPLLAPGEHHHAFSALNALLAVDGAFLDLPAGTVLDEPIELVLFTDPGGRPLLVSPRSLLRFGEGSRATIVETYAGTGDERYCTNAVTEVVLEEGATVEHYHLQDESEDAFHFSSLGVSQGMGSRFSSRLVALGSGIARHEVAVRLGGEGAEAHLDGLFFPRGTQHHDHPILVEHAAPRCVSRQRYVGIVDGRGRGVFNGHVVVRPGAAGTDASQSNKNLLLSDRAEVDTRPRLEILADDVACAHGATVGRLNSDALFYLRSRGIPETRARGVLIEGFARQVLDRLGLEPMRARVAELIAGRLAPDPGEPPPSKHVLAGERALVGQGR